MDVTSLLGTHSDSLSPLLHAGGLPCLESRVVRELDLAPFQSLAFYELLHLLGRAQ